MERAIKFVEVSYQITVTVALWLVVGYVLLKYTEGDKISVVINEQKAHKTLIERLQERLDKIKSEEDDRHRGILDRFKNLERQRSDIGAEQ